MKTTAKRKLKEPRHRWLPSEIKALLLYLKGKEIEKPTSREFYTKFLKSIDLDIEWNLPKNKVRYLKKIYCRALDLQPTVVLDPKNKGRSFEEVMESICPFYDLCHDVWGDSVTMTSPSTNVQPGALLLKSLGIARVAFDEQKSSDESSEDNTTIPIIPTIRPKKRSKPKYARLCSRTMLQDLMFSQVMRQKFNVDKLNLERRKFKFEREKALRELELREKKLDLQKAESSKAERLRMLEIKSNERIAIKELELKYK